MSARPTNPFATPVAEEPRSGVTKPAPSPRRRLWTRAALAIVALVPLAFAGLAMASLGDSGDGVNRIPAAIVNQDQMVFTTAPDGTKSPVLAGRQLVTELTGEDSPGMSWELTNAEDAEKALADGEVYAVLTIPSDFSSSVLSLSSESPTQAQLSIRTDDAHSYLAGSVAQSLGDGMVRAFGAQVTEQYISGIYAQFGELGTSLGQASDGATQLRMAPPRRRAGRAASPPDSRATPEVSPPGLRTRQARDRQRRARPAEHRHRLATPAGSPRSPRSSGRASAALAANPADPLALATVQALSAQLVRRGRPGRGTQPAGHRGDRRRAVRHRPERRRRPNPREQRTRSCERSQGLASGTAQLSSGATELATGLKSGADQLPAADSAQAADAASVAAEPVTLDVTTDNPIAGAAQAIGTYAVPLGLWIGALAIFLVMRPVSRRVLASTAASGRVIGSTLSAPV